MVHTLLSTENPKLFLADVFTSIIQVHICWFFESLNLSLDGELSFRSEFLRPSIDVPMHVLLFFFLHYYYQRLERGTPRVGAGQDWFHVATTTRIIRVVSCAQVDVGRNKWTSYTPTMRDLGDDDMTRVLRSCWRLIAPHDFSYHHRYTPSSLLLNIYLRRLFDIKLWNKREEDELCVRILISSYL
jgi:hypothetical protein